MEIIRPQKKYIDYKSFKFLTASFFTKRDIVNDKDEFIDTLIFPTIQFIEKGNEDEKFNLAVDEKSFTKELGLKFNGYTYGIGKIVRLSEINSNKLSSFIMNYFMTKDIEEFYKRNSDCEKLREYQIKENINILTFGNMVNILRNIVKTDTCFHSLKNLSTKDKRKAFRKTFVDYVKDRDCFTHGILFFEYPSFEPILKVKDKDGNDYYINYSKEIFLSNLQTFNYLFDIVSEMEESMKNCN